MSATPSLQILYTVSSMRLLRATLPGLVSLVPTMGMLHEGHKSLIRLAAQQTQCVIVSIYVNLAQLADATEKASYPAQLDSDVAALQHLDEELAEHGRGRIKGVFAPTDEEMYPYKGSTDIANGLGTFITISPLARRLEGADQPTHFVGVATICMKLFNAVRPHNAYFGEKDFQQTLLIKRLVKDMLLDVQIIVGKTVREQDSLAMSSRNVALGCRRRKVATVLWKALSYAATAYRDGEIRREKILALCFSEAREEQRKQEQMTKVERVRFEIIYFALSDLETVDELEEVDPRQGALLSGAIRMLPLEVESPSEGSNECIRMDPVRLIDSVVLEPIKALHEDLVKA